MSDHNRREVLRAFLRGALQAGGTVVLAAVVVPAVEAGVDRAGGNALQQRADRLAAAEGQGGTGQGAEGGEEFCRFVNGAFRNGGGGGGFRNAAFRNSGGGGGAFRNGGFVNGGGGGGGFRNGGFVNGAFRNY